MERATSTQQVRPARWRMALVFALTILIIGMAPAGLTFGLDVNAATRLRMDTVFIPTWLFTVVWLVIYPSIGIATWLIWGTRDRHDVSVPMAIGGAALLQTLSFWLSNSIQMIAVIDATGLLLAYTVAWVYARYHRAAVWWLLPWLVWMPVTLVVKLLVLWGGAA
jgi:translocator protein